LSPSLLGAGDNPESQLLAASMDAICSNARWEYTVVSKVAPKSA